MLMFTRYLCTNWWKQRVSTFDVLWSRLHILIVFCWLIRIFFRTIWRSMNRTRFFLIPRSSPITFDVVWTEFRFLLIFLSSLRTFDVVWREFRFLLIFLSSLRTFDVVWTEFRFLLNPPWSSLITFGAVWTELWKRCLRFEFFHFEKK